MRRFILIDHSIKGFGGHHYEYAVHVLNAAHQAGFKTILGVNRDFQAKDHAPEPWEIVPAYEHGFWRSTSAAPSTPTSNWKSRLFDHWIKLKYGPLGKFFWTLPEFRYHYTPATIFAEYRGKWQLFPMLLGLFLIKYPYGVIQAIHYLLRVIVSPARDYLIRIAKAVIHLVVMLLYPLRLFKHLWLFKSILHSKKLEAHHEFGRDTTRLFEKIGIAQNDVVFIPTLSEKDMLGLREFYDSFPDAHKASWHLLFRRNLFDGPDPMDRLAPRPEARRAFRQFHQNLNGNVIKFYTDTDRLSDEYTSLGVSRFHTLPIPINPALVEKSTHATQSSSLRIVYAGDARTEKGYHHIPDLIRDLEGNALSDKVVFEIQSNMAQARLEDATAERLALRELELFDGDRINLLRAPLDSNQYFDLVSTADILLILYDAKNYYSRSSGILVEALAAGIPVIIPADSWMGQQLADANYRYLADLEKSAEVVGRSVQPFWMVTSKPLKPRVTKIKKKKDPTAKREPRLPRKELTLEVPRGRATHLLIKFDRPAQLDAGVVVHASQWAAGHHFRSSSRLLHVLNDHAHCLALFELHTQTDSVGLEFISIHGANSATVTNLETEFLHPGSQPLFADAVGRAYLPEDGIARHLRELIENYAHYRSTAQEYSQYWNSRHSASRLVQELIA